MEEVTNMKEFGMEPRQRKAILEGYLENLRNFVGHADIKEHLAVEDKIRIRTEIDGLETFLDNSFDEDPERIILKNIVKHEGPDEGSRHLLGFARRSDGGISETERRIGKKS